MACLDCSQCENLGLLDICCEAVVFGQADAETSYTMKITDVTTGAIFMRTITTDESGDVWLTLAEIRNKFAIGRTYEVRIYEALCDFSNPVEMTNGDTTADCFGFEFFKGVDFTPPAE